MRDLSEDKRKLKKTLGEKGITHVLKYLKEILPSDVPKYDVLVQIEGEYRDVKMKMLEGLLNQQDIGQANARIRRRLIDFINSLEPEDFLQGAKGTNFDETSSIKRGHVLYQVPQRMQLFEEVRCMVRIAFDKAMLIEDIDIDENTQFRSNVRISDYMKVEFIDPASTPVFEIRSTSEPIQFIDQDDFTEWRFYVKPLQAGKHILELKVNIIIQINDKEVIREKTLEESVVIVAEEVPELDTGFKQFGESFVSERGLVDDIQIKSVKDSSGFRLPKNVRMLALLLIGTFGIGTASYAFVPSFAQEVDWTLANTIQQNEKSYERFIEKYETKLPQSKRLETAYYKKAVVQDTPEALRGYIQEHPQSVYQEDASWELAELTQDPIDYLDYASRHENTTRTKVARQKVIENETLILETVTAKQDTNGLRLLEKYLRVVPEQRNSELLKPVIRKMQPVIKKGGFKSDLPQLLDPKTDDEPRKVPKIEEGSSIQRSTTTRKQPNEPSRQPETSEDNTTLKEDSRKEDVLDLSQGSLPASSSTDQKVKNTNEVKVEEEKKEENKPAYKLPQMVYVQGGTFEMGDQFGDGGEEEKPVHKVTLSNYYLGRNEVTFEEYDLFCIATNRDLPEDEGWGRGQRPVIHVSWYDAVDYCNWLSEQEELQVVYTRDGEIISANWKANGYRLPTEAEWEYAARSKGQKEKWAGTNDEKLLNEYAINLLLGNGKSELVRNYKPNTLGLYDMSGNVAEWCWDWAQYYEESKGITNPKGPAIGETRMTRGGHFNCSSGLCRTVARGGYEPGEGYYAVGFRLARSPR